MNKSELRYVKRTDIIIGDRFREDYGDMDNFVESIREKGILQPVTLDQNLHLLAGGRRMRAAEMLELEEVPALIRQSEGAVDAREVELIENLHRKEMSWSEEAALVQEIDRLYKELNTDWSARKTAQLLDRSAMDVSRKLKLARMIDVMPELAEAKTADDALKSIRKMEDQAIVQELRERQENRALIQGVDDVLKLAKANYVIGDVFERMAAFQDNSCTDLIECDPPYGIDLSKVKRNNTTTVTTYNEIEASQYELFLEDLCTELFRMAGRNCWLVFWFGPTWFTEVKAALTDAGWIVDDIPGIWVKPQGQTMQPTTNLGRGYEPFFVCRKGSPALNKPGRLNVFNYAPVPGPQKYHPTQRPIELMEELLDTFAFTSAHVFVPFLGSGTTLRAAYNLGMIASGSDLNPEYKDRFLIEVEADARKLFNEEDE